MPNINDSDISYISQKNECEHKRITDAYREAGYETTFFTGFCNDCKEMVYARTGNKTIKWNLDRNATFKD